MYVNATDAEKFSVEKPLEKAFEALRHDRLLHKYMKLDTIHMLITLIKSFISSRTFAVRVDEEI